MKLGCGTFFIFFIFLIISTGFISKCDSRDVENGEKPVYFVNIIAFDTKENKYLCFSYNEREQYLKNENITLFLPENSAHIQYSQYDYCDFEEKEKTKNYILYKVFASNDDFSTENEYKVFSKNNLKLTKSSMFHMRYMILAIPLAFVLLLIFKLLFKLIYKKIKEKYKDKEKFSENLKKKLKIIISIFIVFYIPFCILANKTIEYYYSRNIEKGETYNWKTNYVVFDNLTKKYLCLENDELIKYLSNNQYIFKISEEICGKKMEGNSCNYELLEKNNDYFLYSVTKTYLNNTITTEYKVLSNNTIKPMFTKYYFERNGHLIILLGFITTILFILLIFSVLFLIKQKKFLSKETDLL